MIRSLYIVLARSPRRWRNPVIVSVRKRKPALKEGQAMVKLELDIKDNIFDPPRVPLVINDTNLIRAVPEVRT